MRQHQGGPPTLAEPLPTAPASGAVSLDADAAPSPQPGRRRPKAWLVAVVALMLAVVLFTAGVATLAPRQGVPSVLAASVIFEPRLPDGTVCPLKPVDFELVATFVEGAGDLAVEAAGFAVEALDGGGTCEGLNGLVGLPTTETSLTLNYISTGVGGVGDPGDVNAIGFVLTSGALVVGNRFSAAVEPDSGSITGTRNVVTGGVDGQISFDEFVGVVRLGGDDQPDRGGDGGLAVIVGSQPAAVTGNVAPGPGRNMLVGGLVALVMGVGAVGVGMVARRQRSTATAMN